MRLGIFAKTFVGGPLEVTQAARAAGFAEVQYNMACSGLGALPRHVPEPALVEIRAAQNQTGLSISALSATYNMIHPDLPKRLEGRESFATLAACAKAMGTRILTVCTGSADAHDQWRAHPDNATPAAWAAMCAEFEALIPLAEAHDLLIGVEPELANVVASARDARRLIDQLQSDRIRIVLDPANLVERADPPTRARVIAEAVDLLGDGIAMAHAKDRAADGSFVAAGKGVVDFPDFLRRLKGIGFDGPLVTHGLTAEEAPGVAAFLRGLA